MFVRPKTPQYYNKHSFTRNEKICGLSFGHGVTCSDNDKPFFASTFAIGFCGVIKICAREKNRVFWNELVYWTVFLDVFFPSNSILLSLFHEFFWNLGSVFYIDNMVKDTNTIYIVIVYVFNILKVKTDFNVTKYCTKLKSTFLSSMNIFF